MNNLTLILLLLLLGENLLLLGLFLIWTNRHCKKCDKDKEITKAFSPLCAKCGKKNGDKL